MQTSDKARVFFALWPETSAQQALHGLATKYAPTCKARAMDANALHITLVFLGEVERARLPQLIDIAGKVSEPPFGFKLEKLACWPRNKIACATLLQEMPTLSQLVIRLKQALTEAGFAFGEGEFIPHVTLLRQVKSELAQQVITPIDWWADSFVLAESTVTDQGSHYQILQEWPLTPISRG
jgi:RNA 2',3'-cyclic 3'-phosphodiesterase